jgi:hypothetical protein
LERRLTRWFEHSVFVPDLFPGIAGRWVAGKHDLKPVAAAQLDRPAGILLAQLHAAGAARGQDQDAGSRTQ